MAAVFAQEDVESHNGGNDEGERSKSPRLGSLTKEEEDILGMLKKIRAYVEPQDVYQFFDDLIEECYITNRAYLTLCHIRHCVIQLILLYGTVAKGDSTYQKTISKELEESEGSAVIEQLHHRLQNGHILLQYINRRLEGVDTTKDGDGSWDEHLMLYYPVFREFHGYWWIYADHVGAASELYVERHACVFDPFGSKLLGKEERREQTARHSACY